ncbi:MAG: metallophosphoesterase [Acidobacteriota bacterium]
MSLVPALLLAALTVVSGVVFDDGNANGRRDPGEGGLPNVVVSDGVEVAVTAPDGAYRLAAIGRNVFVVVPGDRRATAGWYRRTSSAADFALAPSPAAAVWRFAHLSDTHLDAGNVDRMRHALALARSREADFAIVTGDLNRDALRVDEATARSRMERYASEAAGAPLPVRSAPGNHDIFGIERHLSLVPRTNPVYGKTLYEEILGPRYYSFDRGHVHFVVLDTLGIDDLWYYGLLEEDELAWLRKDLARVRPGTTVVTAGHVPLRTGRFSNEFAPDGPERTLLTVGGVTFYRHVVRNADALAQILKPYRWTLALQGHTHTGERLRLFDGGETRFHTAPAVDHPPGETTPSGFFVYTVRGDEIDDGELLWLDAR